MSPQYGELRPTNIWDRFGSLGHPANFNGFRVLSSLLQRRRSPEVNQILHDVWSSPGLVHYIYIFGISCPLTDVAKRKIHFVSRSCVLLYWQSDCTGLQQRGQPNFAAWYKEWNYGTVAEGATYIFGWAAITLGIGPYSGYYYNSSCLNENAWLLVLRCVKIREFQNVQKCGKWVKFRW